MPPRVRRIRTPKPKKQPVSYTDGSAVRTIANRLIAGNAEKIPGLVKGTYEGGRGVTLPGLSHLRQATIAFLFSTSEKVGQQTLGQASKFAKKLWPLVKEEFDFLIVVSKPQWDRLDDDQRHALTYHLLLRCGVNEKEQYVVAQPEFVGFYSEIRLFGLWNERSRVMAQQMRLFEIGSVRVIGGGKAAREAERAATAPGGEQAAQ